MNADAPAISLSDRPIKVMHVIARLNIGGAALYVIQLTACLGTPDFESQLVCGVVGKDEGDMRYVADEKHLPVTVIPSLGREISPVGDIATIYKLWRLMRRERPDVVHTHTAKAGFVGRLAARLAGVPVVVHTFHGHVFAGYFGPVKTRLFLLLERFSTHLSSAIITLSAALKHELTTVYHVAPADRVEVIELGFECGDLAVMPRHQGSFRSEHQIPPDAPLVGIVGRLVPIKNHELFLRAAKLLLKRVPGAYFAVVGDGERRAELVELAHSLGIADRVRFTGWITDILPVYSALDVLVLTSRNEGMPVSLIEALAAGVPVVATDVGGVRDLLSMWQIVPRDDPGALAATMVIPLNDPDYQVTETERAEVAERYSIRRSADRVAALYRRLLQS
jgi:glycosyltransferase involved in cell wall biosynthesis